MATYGFCENKCKHEVYTKPEVDEKVKEIYSTEEQVIGTWIDGKPIYRKIFTGVSIMNQELVTPNQLCGRIMNLLFMLIML